MSVATGWLRVTVSGKVASGPIVLTGVYFNASVTGSEVTLYHGEDSGSGDEIITLINEGEMTEKTPFDNPIYLPRGLYLEVGTNVTEVLVTWFAIPED